MKRIFLATAAVLLAAAATTWALATAPRLGSQIGATIQLGAPVTSVQAPACPPGVKPAMCLIVLTRSTTVQMLVDGVSKPAKVVQPGEIVGFTIGLAQLSSSATTTAADIKNLSAAYGGPAEAQLTILKPAANYRWTAVAEGPLVRLAPYFGYVVQFPLKTPLQVTPGESVGLTIPTWAPILSYNLTPSRYLYRQSRTPSKAAPCAKPSPTQAALLLPGQSAQFLCAYPGTRVEASFTELTTPVPPGTKTPPTPKK
jgi:hypothetical protein